MKYELLTGNHGRSEDGANKVYKAGDHIELSPEEAASMGDRVRLISVIQPAADPVVDEDSDDQESPPVPSALIGNVRTVGANVRSFTNVLELMDLHAAESASQNRKGVLSVIESRVEELKEG